MTPENVYRKNRGILHDQLSKLTGSPEARIASIYKEVLDHASIHEELFADVKPGDTYALHNRLRYYAYRLDVSSDRFHFLSIREYHRFCQRMKDLLPRNIDTEPYEVQAVANARRDLMVLVQEAPECGDEQLIQWMQTYLDTEVLVAHFTDMWEKLKPSLQWQAQSKTRHQEDAEDLQQQTYLHALKYIRKHRRMPEEGKMKAWLGKTMHHAFLDNVRDRGRLLTEPIMDEHAEKHLDEEDVEQTVIEEQERQELEHILESLSEEDRKVMELYLLRGISLREIAEELNENLEAIRARFKRARPKVLAKLSAKSLHEYLERSPQAQTKAQKLLQRYIPNKAAKGYNLADITIEKEYDVLVRYILSLHVEGYDHSEIAELLTVEKENLETFELRVAAIQKCLDENLFRLFSSFYGRI